MITEQDQVLVVEPAWIAKSLEEITRIQEKELIEPDNDA